MRADKERERSREKRHRRDQSHGNQAKERPKKDRPRREIRQKTQINRVNRSLVCPFLVRVYYCINGINHYGKQFQLPKDQELILYLWTDSTLKEIAELLRAHLPLVRTKQRFIFSHLFDQNGKLTQKAMGTVMVHKKDKNYFEQEEMTLEKHSFCIGDYIDVSIYYK